jgi:hypothetical protein
MYFFNDTSITPIHLKVPGKSLLFQGNQGATRLPHQLGFLQESVQMASELK